MRPAAAALLLALAAACSTPRPVPAPGFAARGGDLAFPRLLPFAAFDPPATGAAPEPETREATLQAREEALRARAAALAGPVLSATERRRLLAARARLGG